MNNTLIAPSRIWHSPSGAFNHCLKALDTLSAEEIKKKGLEKKIPETQVVSMLCFALYKLHDTPYFLQLVKNDPPDAFIARGPNYQGTLEVGAIEVTSYFRNKNGLPKLSVLDQLKQSKTFKNYHKYSEHDLVLVHFGTGLTTNFSEINAYLKSIRAPYQLWFLQEVQSYHDTIVELTMCYPNFQQVQVDVGEAHFEYEHKNIPRIVTAKRVANINDVRVEASDESVNKAPWETIE